MHFKWSHIFPSIKLRGPLGVINMKTAYFWREKSWSKILVSFRWRILFVEYWQLWQLLTNDNFDIQSGLSKCTLGSICFQMFRLKSSICDNSCNVLWYQMDWPCSQTFAQGLRWTWQCLHPAVNKRGIVPSFYIFLNWLGCFICFWTLPRFGDVEVDLGLFFLPQHLPDKRFAIWTNTFDYFEK